MTFLMKRHSPETGFTLLEVLVSVTLVAVMAVGLWALFRISIRSWSRGTGFIDANQHYRSILDAVRKQMASAYPLFSPLDMQQGGLTYPIFSGDENNLRFVSLNSLQFRESPGLTYVSYEVTQDAKSEYSLIERETPYTGQPPDDATMETSRATTIFENLVECGFEYFDKGDGGANPPQWVSAWDPQKLNNRVPLAVSVRMMSRDSQGNSLSRRIVAPISAEPIDPRFSGSSRPFGAAGR
jgi:prepilin-type N-terminal cleavage/methylation domain-containing protein